MKPKKKPYYPAKINTMIRMDTRVAAAFMALVNALSEEYFPMGIKPFDDEDVRKMRKYRA